MLDVESCNLLHGITWNSFPVMHMHIIKWTYFAWRFNSQVNDVYQVWAFHFKCIINNKIPLSPLISLYSSTNLDAVSTVTVLTCWLIFSRDFNCCSRAEVLETYILDSSSLTNCCNRWSWDFWLMSSRYFNCCSRAEELIDNISNSKGPLECKLANPLEGGRV